MALMDNRQLISLIKSDLNWVPLSLRISFGMPTHEKISTRDSATVTVSMFFSGTPYGKRVAKSIRVKIYFCPRLDGVSGPTISIATLENGH